MRQNLHFFKMRLQKSTVSRVEREGKYGIWVPIGIFAALIFSPNLVAAFYLMQNESFQRGASLLIFSLIALAIPLLFVKTLRQLFIAYIPLSFLAPAYVAYGLAFRSAPSEGIIVSVLHTTFAEAVEFVESAGWVSFLPLLWGLTYSIFAFRSRALNKKVNLRFKKILAGLGAFYLLLIVASLLNPVANFQKRTIPRMLFWFWDMEAIKANTDVYAFLDEQTIQDSFPFGLARVLYDDVHLNNAVVSSKVHYGAYKKQPISEKEVYILIIGESSRYQNWELHGYGRQTSPHLAELARNGELLDYSDMAAQANLTYFAASMMIAGETPEIYAKKNQVQAAAASLPDQTRIPPAWRKDTQRNKIEATIAGAFKEAGFKTGWISNQDFQYPAFADFSDFDWSLHRHDEAMLPVIARSLAQHGDKLFLVIHTRGSHSQYDQRYAKRYKAYAPTLDDVDDQLPRFSRFRAGTASLPKMREAMVNSYDNTILATDDLLSRVISAVEKRHAVSTVLFVSDHGENLCDDDRQLFVHGNRQVSKYEIHNPAFVWTSSAYRARYPEKQKALEAHINSKLSQANVFSTLLDMADVGLPTEDLNKSFASMKFAEPSLRPVLTPSLAIENYEDLK